MKVIDVMAAIEEFAPLCAQDSFDNSGLLVGDPQAEVCGVLLCLDITPEVLEEAIAMKMNMIVSHHPVIFHPLRSVTPASVTQQIVAKAIMAGVALYACHTNLDSVPGGMSFRMGEMLGVHEMEILLPRESAGAAPIGYGVVGHLNEEEEVMSFLWRVKERFSCDVIRHSVTCGQKVRRIALSSGSGASMIPAARAAGADIFISADFKYNDFFPDVNSMVVADIGHFESEYCAIDLLFDIIRKKIPIFAIHKSKESHNPVNYLA